MDQLNTALVVMGFDPDRAQLISSLLIGGVAACTATLVTGRFGPAVAAGFGGAVLLYCGTFVAETQAALGATGAYGAFDPGGWVLTLVTLIVSATASAWAGAALGATARPWTVRAVGVSVEAITRRHLERGTARYPILVGAVLVLLLVTVPAFGELVNFAPDSLMRGGAAPQPVAAAPSATPEPTAAAPAATIAASPSAGNPATAAPTPSPSPAAPWLAWVPSGSGRVTRTTMAAPWKGGTASSVDVTIYTPPGYDPKGARRYPVLYEAPTGYALWNGATNARSALDSLIDAGSIPPSIVVFIDSAGGPYPNTQCADSFDGRQWFDLFVSRTVVGWVDRYYKTMATPTARAIAGMSEGGYCAAILALHHPTEFGTSISFSGYYQAGVGGGSSAAPFGGNWALVAADSPTVVAGKIAIPTRDQLYFVVIAKPDQPSFGPQATEFEKTLSGDGYPYTALAATEPHGWTQVRDYFPAALKDWAAREVATGVFTGS